MHVSCVVRLGWRRLRMISSFVAWFWLGKRSGWIVSFNCTSSAFTLNGVENTASSDIFFLTQVLFLILHVAVFDSTVLNMDKDLESTGSDSFLNACLLQPELSLSLKSLRRTLGSSAEFRHAQAKCLKLSWTLPRVKWLAILVLVIYDSRSHGMYFLQIHGTRGKKWGHYLLDEFEWFSLLFDSVVRASESPTFRALSQVLPTLFIWCRSSLSLFSQV